MKRIIYITIGLIYILLTSNSYASLELDDEYKELSKSDVDGYLFVIEITPSDKKIVQIDKFQGGKAKEKFLEVTGNSGNSKNWGILLRKIQSLNCNGPMCGNNDSTSTNIGGWLLRKQGNDAKYYQEKLKELKNKNQPITCETLQIDCPIAVVTNKEFTKIMPFYLNNNLKTRMFPIKPAHISQCYGFNGSIRVPADRYSDATGEPTTILDDCVSYYRKSVSDPPVNFWSNKVAEVSFGLDKDKFMADMNAMSDELTRKATEYEATLVEQAQRDAQEKIKQDQENAERVAAAEKQRKENEIYITEQRPIERKAIDDFRKSIAVGTKTNCGLVIERKPTMAQVYIPVKDYGNEHWIEISRLYPQDYACNFINGTYVNPSYRF